MSETLVVFRRAMRLSLRNPTWVIIGLSQPILYLVLFGPLLKPLASQLGTGNAYRLLVPGILVQLGIFGALFVGFGLIAEYRAGVIETQRVTPAPRTALLMGRVMRDVIVLADGDAALFARAAFGTHRVTTVTESSRSEVIALLDEALAALEREGAADGDPARWLLSASLARELADGPDRDLPRAVDFARAAVDGARRTGDASVLAYALFALADVRWAPGTAAERLEIAG